MKDEFYGYGQRVMADPQDDDMCDPWDDAALVDVVELARGRTTVLRRSLVKEKGKQLVSRYRRRFNKQLYLIPLI